MKSFFHARLVNDRFDDPGVYVDIPWESRGILFDLGANYDLAPRRLLKVTDVFVSHAHIDHFIGFDHLLRYRLGRERPLRLFGPPGILDRVAGKLSGYSWNLIEEYPFEMDVVEIEEGTLKRRHLAARDRFQPGGCEEASCSGEVAVVFRDDVFEARATLLDHRIPCAAFAIEERAHVNINRVALEEKGLATGPWLRTLKDKVRGEADDDEMVELPHGDKLPLGELREAIVSVTAGQKLAYVVDALFSERNVRRILELVAQADVLYCGAPFLERDRERALSTHHLTALQAGWIGRAAGAKRLEVFHFSPRYENEPEALAKEAADGFQGEREPMPPVDV